MAWCWWIYERAPHAMHKTNRLIITHRMRIYVDHDKNFIFSLLLYRPDSTLFFVYGKLFVLCRYRPSRIEWPLNKPSQWLIIIKVLEQTVRSCRVWVWGRPLLAFDYVSIMECLCESLICKWIISISSLSSLSWLHSAQFSRSAARSSNLRKEKTKAKQSKKRERVYMGGKKRRKKGRWKAWKVGELQFRYFFLSSSVTTAASIYTHRPLCDVFHCCCCASAEQLREMVKWDDDDGCLHHTTIHSQVRIDFHIFLPLFFAPSPHIIAAAKLLHPPKEQKRQQQRRKMFRETQTIATFKVEKLFSLCDSAFFVCFYSLKIERRKEDEKK